MKSINNYIIEKLTINSKSKVNKIDYNYHPKTRDELKELIKKLIKERGNEADLNDIDTSNIKGMSNLFEYTEFDGDISKWDVSNVVNMHCMFNSSEFTGKNGDISDWDTRNVKYMDYMFNNSKFNSDISNWNVSNVEDMKDMFNHSSLEKNPPKWYKN